MLIGLKGIMCFLQIGIIVCVFVKMIELLSIYTNQYMFQDDSIVVYFLEKNNNWSLVFAGPVSSHCCLYKEAGFHFYSWPTACDVHIEDCPSEQSYSLC